jgi:SagB-type dehydrogenase family enzyme
VLFARKSSREFSGKPITLDEISEILNYSSGVVEKTGKKGEGFYRRPYPSAGARYPLEIYPLVLHGTGELSKGLYHYNPISNSLDVLLRKIALKNLKPIWLGQSWAEKASVVLIITAVFERTTSKYGNKGIGFCLIEAGHLAQNIYLTSQERSIGCCAIGKLREELVNDLLDVRPEEEIPIYYLALGRTE